MTDDEIIKALKYCIDEEVPCDNCPCWKNCCNCALPEKIDSKKLQKTE